MIPLGVGAEGVTSTDQSGQANGKAYVVAGMEVGLHAGEFEGQLLKARQLAILAYAEHGVAQATDEDLSYRDVLSCRSGCRERDAGGCRGGESQKLPSPH
ncbi:hypothetical protein GCM10010289_73010 [Streptomyces violascens]|nr:hypothetical protein GCM10010289_73010 [Streptomyces violascens]